MTEVAQAKWRHTLDRNIVQPDVMLAEGSPDSEGGIRRLCREVLRASHRLVPGTVELKGQGFSAYAGWSGAVLIDVVTVIGQKNQDPCPDSTP